MGRSITYDRDELHKTLWEESGRRHVYANNLRTLSSQTGISYFYLTRIIKEFVEQGRVKPLTRGQHKLQTFIVADPETWRP